MVSSRAFCLFLLACQFFCADVPAQSSKVGPKYYVEHFGEDEGLPQNSVNSIFPDSQGFLWVATESGIARFNGNRFLPVNIKPGLANTNFTRIKSFYKAGGDTIIAHSSANQLVAVIVNNRIEAFERPDPQKHGLLFWSQHIRINVPGYLLATGNEQVRRRWHHGKGVPNGALYNKDTFAVTLNDGVAFYDAKGFIGESPVPHTELDRLIYANGKVVFIDAGNNANFLTPAGLQKKLPLNIPGRPKLAVFPNSFGNGFFCVADSVLYGVNIKGSGELETRRLLTNLTDAAAITLIYQRDSNTIITGTATNGLYVYKKSLFSLSDPVPGVTDDVFYVQHLMPDNATILTGRDKLFRFTSFVGKTKAVYTTHDYALIRDSQGFSWYVFQHYLLKARQLGVRPDTVCSFTGRPGILFEDSYHNIWFSTTERFGYFQGKNFHEVKTQGFSPEHISYMEQGPAGNYFIGTNNRGLFTLAGINAPHAIPVAALSSFDIRFILPEADGRVWVCTYGHGFFLLEKEKLTHFPENGGTLSYVHCFVGNGNGYFWLPSNNGLFVVSRRSLLAYSSDNNKLPFYYRFSRKNGLRTNEFNGGTMPAYLRLPDGEISLATIRGLVQFDPERVETSFTSTPILVESIQLDSSAIVPADKINVASTVKNARFYISNSFWGEQENELLEYKLARENETGNNRWSQVDASGIINLFSLSRGNYQLIIRKRTGLNENDFLTKTISLAVSPKWYQTYAFFVAAYVVTLLFMLGLLYWRRNVYRRSNRVLKEKVDAATAELQHANSNLERKVEERTRAIQEAEIKFRTLVEKSLVGVYIVKNNKFVYVNPKFAEMFGYSQAEILRIDSTNDLVFGPDKEFVSTNALKSEIDDTHQANYVFRGIRSDGNIIHLERFGSKIQYEGGPAVIGTLLDITDKKLAEEQLIKEKELSQSIINSLPGVFFIYDANRKHLSWNRNLEKVTGYNAQELAEKPAGSCLEPTDSKLFVYDIESTFAAGHAELEVVLITRSGERIPFYLNEIAITHEGKPAILAIGIDISERKRAEQEKERANYLLNERIKELTTLYRAGVLLQGEERSIENMLEEFVSILPGGWQYSEITEARVVFDGREFITRGFRSGVSSQRARFTTGGGLVGMVEVIYKEERRQEDEGPFLAEERKLIDMLADMLGKYFTRKEAVEQTKLAEKKQVEYTQSLEEMIFMTSHEVRKPVANLLGLADLADTIDLNANEAREINRYVKFSAKELDNFTRKLISFIYEIKARNMNPENEQENS